MNAFELIPQEIVDLILSHLTLKDRANISITSRFMESIASPSRKRDFLDTRLYVFPSDPLAAFCSMTRCGIAIRDWRDAMDLFSISNLDYVGVYLLPRGMDMYCVKDSRDPTSCSGGSGVRFHCVDSDTELQTNLVLDLISRFVRDGCKGIKLIVPIRVSGETLTPCFIFISRGIVRIKCSFESSCRDMIALIKRRFRVDSGSYRIYVGGSLSLIRDRSLVLLRKGELRELLSLGRAKRRLQLSSSESVKISIEGREIPRDAVNTILSCLPRSVLELITEELTDSVPIDELFLEDSLMELHVLSYLCIVTHYTGSWKDISPLDVIRVSEDVSLAFRDRIVAHSENSFFIPREPYRGNARNRMTIKDLTKRLIVSDPILRSKRPECGWHTEKKIPWIENRIKEIESSLS